jgi:phospholipase/carboxylesterase
MLDCEFIPAREKDSKRLLVMLHGLGDSREGYRWMPEELALPWLNYLLVDAPDAYYGGFSWFEFAGDIVPGVGRSRKLLFDLLDAQRAKGFPTEQTVLGGFSQGCLMSIDVGLRYPRRLAGIVGISGFVCEPERLLRELSPVGKEQRLLITHGDFDPMVPIGMTRRQIQQLQAAGLNIDWREFPKAHTIAGESELALMRSFIQSASGK